MGMSPRIKAKKGRFGIGGLVPTLNIVSSPIEVTTLVANTTDFIATATDDIDGVLDADIDWASDLDGGSVGTGGTPSITLTTLGTHIITVSVTAATGAFQVDSATIEVLVVAA